MYIQVSKFELVWLACVNADLTAFLIPEVPEGVAAETDRPGGRNGGLVALARVLATTGVLGVAASPCGLGTDNDRDIKGVDFGNAGVDGAALGTSIAASIASTSARNAESMSKSTSSENESAMIVAYKLNIRF